MKEGYSRWTALSGLVCCSVLGLWDAGKTGGGGVGHSLWDSKQGRSPEEGTCEM